MWSFKELQIKACSVPIAMHGVLLKLLYYTQTHTLAAVSWHDQQRGVPYLQSTVAVLEHTHTQALRFGRGNKSIVGMISSEEESFTFHTSVAIEGPVEQWMARVEAEMRGTLYQISKEGVFYYAKTAR
jgi:hypothetical protein